MRLFVAKGCDPLLPQRSPPTSPQTRVVFPNDPPHPPSFRQTLARGPHECKARGKRSPIWRANDTNTTRLHGSNEGHLFELGHKWSKLFLGFGTQDLERQFGAQVSSYARQAHGLSVVGHGFFEKPSSPLGAFLGAATPATIHDFYDPSNPALTFIVTTDTSIMVQMTFI